MITKGIISSIVVGSFNKDKYNIEIIFRIIFQ